MSEYNSEVIIPQEWLYFAYGNPSTPPSHRSYIPSFKGVISRASKGVFSVSSDSSDS